ncbi:hypothetical protein [Paenibacillus sp. DMB5]|uniref:hypothetical protein n=1 Tax=Paenibacillus sp. DMB5 TaxID=1780103 RepID=UPI00076C50F1|nr:hypothetical protein [Paenibacillus sp. DMB5]KUP20519.1 hypothetical protein AWJ19_28070 [Paenibacillus sp. DMB5]
MDMLYHYYEKALGPFRNLSDLPAAEAEEVLGAIRREKEVMASRRPEGYLERRRELEQLARELFTAKGGNPVRTVPHYMVFGECDWLKSWYAEGESVQIQISSFDPGTLSFSYGDLFPTFSPRVQDGREYRSQVYTYCEILQLIEKYGLPQIWNKDGTGGPERYIEVQVWDDGPLKTMIEDSKD